MPSSRRHRHAGGRRAEPPSPSSASSEARDWAALPQDILLTVFLKLGPNPCEVMRGAELVYTTWRRVAVDEPLLWRRIDMGTVSTFSPVGRAVARAALDRGAGQCEAFSGSCDMCSLPYLLLERAPSLKSLHLSCFDGPNQVLVVVLKNLPLLEDLEVSPSLLSIGTENLPESVCQACSLLRKLRIRFSIDEYFDDGIREKIKGIFTTMCELRSLELLDCDLTFEGLAAILDHCPALESLYITGYFDGKMDAELKAKCAKVKNLTLPVPDGFPEEYYYDEGCEWSINNELWRIIHGDRDDLHYDSQEMPYHPQYHYLCDDLDHLDLTDYGFP